MLVFHCLREVVALRGRIRNFAHFSDLRDFTDVILQLKYCISISFNAQHQRSFLLLSNEWTTFLLLLLNFNARFRLFEKTLLSIF